MSGQLLLLITLLGIYSVNGAMFGFREPCPDGVAEGATFVPFSQTPAQCMQCQCHSGRDSYSCATCGLANIELPQPDCYQAPSQPDALYPDCCEIKPVCPGDAGYDPSLAGNVIGAPSAGAKRRDIPPWPAH